MAIFLATKEAIGMLEGVGRELDFWKDGKIALHLRRQLTDTEIALLDPEWLKLPAIDEAE